MLVMATYDNTNQPDGYKGEERRIHSHLREYYETACRITAPLLDKEHGMNGAPLKLSALYTLRNQFPDLSQQDLATLFAVARNVHNIRRHNPDAA
jgi:hypothetical protein